MSFQTHLNSTLSLIQNISILPNYYEPCILILTRLIVIFVNMKPLHHLTNSYSQKLISQSYLVMSNIFQTNENFSKGKKMQFQLKN
jgi:hypothetical protein